MVSQQKDLPLVQDGVAPLQQKLEPLEQYPVTPETLQIAAPLLDEEETAPLEEETPLEELLETAPLEEEEV